MFFKKNSLNACGQASLTFVCLIIPAKIYINEENLFKLSIGHYTLNSYHTLQNCGFRYIHPIDKRECPVVVGGDYITTESGTGLVHTAPGHGQEDYVTGMKYGLPILSPVDDDGKFTEEAGRFSGLDVLGGGNSAVAKFLDENLSLIMEEPYSKLYHFT